MHAENHTLSENTEEFQSNSLSYEALTEQQNIFLRMAAKKIFLMKVTKITSLSYWKYRANTSP